MLMQFRDDTNEDGGVTLPYKHNGPKRVTGTTSSRFQLLQIVPSAIYNSGSAPDSADIATSGSPYVDNSGLNAGVLSRFGGFGPFSLSASGGIGTGASFTSNQVSFTNDSSHTDIRNSLNAALSSAGSGYNGKANVILIPTGGATGVGARITVTRNSAGGITGFNVSHYHYCI